MLSEVEQAKLYYDWQVEEVKRQQYIQEALLDRYVDAIRTQINKYDFVNFRDIQEELNSKTKKKPNTKMIKKMVSMDFFDDDDNFKIIDVIGMGYDSYAWRLIIEKDKEIITLAFPIHDKINKTNHQHAYEGKISVGVEKDNYLVEWFFSSYKIEEVAAAIKEHFIVKD